MRSTSRWLPLLVLAVSVGTSVFAQRESDREQYQERFAKTVRLAGDGAVTLSNIAGDIQISTWSRAEVQIEALKVSRAATAELAQANAAEVQIVVQELGNEVRIETKYPKSRNRNLNVSVEYTLVVPDRAAAKINSVSGSIRAENLGGETELQSVSGHVEAQRILGPTEAKSVSGDVSVTDTQGAVICESVSGAVSARNAGGDTRAKSVSGNVTVEMSKGSVEAEAMSGNVQVTEESGAGFDLQASTFSGRIRSDFRLQSTDSIGEHNVSGSVNGGGKRIRAKSFSGDVRLSQQ